MIVAGAISRLPASSGCVCKVGWRDMNLVVGGERLSTHFFSSYRGYQEKITDRFAASAYTYLPRCTRPDPVCLPRLGRAGPRATKNPRNAPRPGALRTVRKIREKCCSSARGFAALYRCLAHTHTAEGYYVLYICICVVYGSWLGSA